MKQFLMGVAAVTAVAMAAPAAQAATVNFAYPVNYTGGTAPSGVLLGSFEDIAGGVRVTVDISNFNQLEFVDEVLFNTNNISVAINYVSGAQASSTGYDPIDGDNDFNAPGGMEFNAILDYPNRNATRFKKENGFTNSVYDFIGIGLDVSDMLVLSSTNNGDFSFFSVAHIQATGPNQDGSAWMGTPIPAAAWLFLSGAGAVGFLARRRKAA